MLFSYISLYENAARGWLWTACHAIGIETTPEDFFNHTSDTSYGWTWAAVGSRRSRRRSCKRVKGPLFSFRPRRDGGVADWGIGWSSRKLAGHEASSVSVLVSLCLKTFDDLLRCFLKGLSSFSQCSMFRVTQALGQLPILGTDLGSTPLVIPLRGHLDSLPFHRKPIRTISGVFGIN